MQWLNKSNCVIVYMKYKKKNPWNLLCDVYMSSAATFDLKRCSALNIIKLDGVVSNVIRSHFV